MSTEEIRQTIKQLIVQVSDVKLEDIGDQASFVDDIGLDSLTLLEVGMAIDYEFKLNVPDEELEQLSTMQDAVALVEQKLSQQAVASE